VSWTRLFVGLDLGCNVTFQFIREEEEEQTIHPTCGSKSLALVVWQRIAYWGSPARVNPTRSRRHSVPLHWIFNQLGIPRIFQSVGCRWSHRSDDQDSERPQTGSWPCERRASRNHRQRFIKFNEIKFEIVFFSNNLLLSIRKVE
jgi:hypothetical protein